MPFVIVHNFFIETYETSLICDCQIWTSQLLLKIFPLFAFFIYYLLFIFLCIFFFLNQGILKFCHCMISSPFESSPKNQDKLKPCKLCITVYILSYMQGDNEIRPLDLGFQPLISTQLFSLASVTIFLLIPKP